jgi:hypothetical protein
MLLAYLDPGTGSIILQSLVAGFMGAMFVIKLFWSKITGFFKRLFGKESETTETEQE